MVQLAEGGREALIRQYGEELRQSFTRWEQEGGKDWWSFKKGTSVVLLRKGETGEEASFSPLTDMTKFVENEPQMVRGIVVDTDVIPWIAPTDKLSQLEFYYSKQSTAIGS